MAAYIIFRQSQTPPCVFDAVKDVLIKGRLWHPCEGEMAEWVAISKGVYTSSDFRRSAAFLSARIKRFGEVVALVDYVDTTALNPLSAGGWSGLLASLIMAFPEVRWVFLVIAGCVSNRGVAEAQEASGSRDLDRELWEAVSELHGPQTILEDRGTPLFDGYGLRKVIRQRMKIDSHRPPDGTGRVFDLEATPCRPKLAVVLDEEANYSLFESLLAYNKGFRVHAIASWQEAVSLLGEGGLLSPPKPTARPEVWRKEQVRIREREHFLLSLEDWYIDFPDQNVRGVSDLKRRTAQLPGLGGPDPPIRRFVTVAHERRRQHGRSKKVERREFLRELRRSEWKATKFMPGKAKPRRSNQRALKPSSGLYSLWSELGLDRAMPNGLAPEYHWPPTFAAGIDGSLFDKGGVGHSSPGRVLLIAEHLIDRASRMCADGRNVPEAVAGAVLATQALELLGCKTATLSAQALALKHEFEVIVECQFMGVGYQLSVEGRIRDIRRNLRAIGEWLHPDRRAAFVLNTEAQILTRLVEVLRRHAIYEAVEHCRVRLRSLHWRISLGNSLARGQLLKLLTIPVTVYVDVVLKSLGHYFVTLAAVVALFAAGFKLFGQPQPFHDAVYCVMTVNILDLRKDGFEPAAFAVWWSYLAAMCGALNIGLLVSHLYSKMSRQT
jgi:hypothetical protein